MPLPRQLAPLPARLDGQHRAGQSARDHQLRHRTGSAAQPHVVSALPNLAIKSSEAHFNQHKHRLLIFVLIPEKP